MKHIEVEDTELAEIIIRIVVEPKKDTKPKKEGE